MPLKHEPNKHESNKHKLKHAALRGDQAMNVWSLNKETRIKHLLLLLNQHLGHSFIIDTEADTTKNAIHLQNIHEASLRAYIFTYAQNKDRYGIHLEYPWEYKRDRTIEIFENIKLTTLLQILSDHLDIPNVPKRMCV